MSDLNLKDECSKGSEKKNFLNRNSITSETIVSSSDFNHSPQTKSFLSRLINRICLKSFKNESMSSLKNDEPFRERDFKKIENIENNNLCVWAIEEELSSHVVMD
jgi:hypothetical protein